MWEDLSFKDRSKLIELGASQGILDLSTIKHLYNINADGGYLKWKKEIAKHKGIDIDNDKTYNYQAFFEEDPQRAWDMLKKDSKAHFTDKYKTVWHPTFSDESVYSGHKSKYNPQGLVGGHWEGNTFRMSDSLYNSPVSMDERQQYLIDNEPNGVSLLESNGTLPVYDGIPWGGVLPEVTVRPNGFNTYANGGSKGRRGATPTRTPIGGNRFRLSDADEESNMSSEEIAEYNRKLEEENAEIARQDAERRARDLEEARRNGTLKHTSFDRTLEAIGEADRKMHQSAMKSHSFDRLRRAQDSLSQGVNTEVATAKEIANASQQYANEQMEKKQQQMHDIKKGFDAAVTALEMGAAGYTIGHLTVPRLIHTNTGWLSKVSDFFTNSNAQLGANAIGSLADGYQLLTADNKFDRYENGIELGGDTAGIVGGLDIVRNSNIFGRYSKPIDTALDTIGLSAATWDIAKNMPPFSYYYGKLKDYVNGTNDTEDNQYAKGGEIEKPKHWKELSMADKADVMSTAIKNGITNLQDIIDKWNEFAEGGSIHIAKNKRGTFKAQASRMGMSTQQAASHILANKDDYSPAMVKKAVFAHNFAHADGGSLESDEDNLLAPIMQYYENSNPSFSLEDQNIFTRGGQMKRARQAVSYFVNKGLTRAQAAGLVGNLMRESGMNITATNPNSGAYGLGQWLGDRRTRLFRRYGYHPTFEQQLDYVWDELNTSHRKGLQMLRASKTVNDAARNAFGYYEFSAGPEAAIRAMNGAGKNTKWKNPNGTYALNSGIKNAQMIFGEVPVTMSNAGDTLTLDTPESTPNIQPIISDDYAPVALANLKELPTFGQEEDNDSSISSFGPQYLAQNLDRLGMANPLNPFEKGYQLQSPKAIYANMQGLI